MSIGHYKIVEKVGQGGMGAVYRAVHETLGRSAAVKLPLPASNHHEMVARLLNEARSAAAIRHPGIVEIYDFGVLPDRTAYIVMEFLDGESLADRLRRERDLPYARTLQIARAVSRILHAAHERGIVHRDLKPDNIFLVPDPEIDGGERVKLLDFGIAKCESAGLEHTLTQIGTAVGTPPYMSPEQCRGAELDRRTDIYSLGCVLYELVCGRPPFIARTAADVIAHHRYLMPARPRSYDQRISPALDALVLWLLQKDPRHRPATAAHVVAAIDDLDVEAIPSVASVPARRLTRPRLRAPVDTIPMMASTSEPPASTTARTSRRVYERGSHAGRRSLRCRSGRAC